ncbi:hypothetical protein BT69DRAFT_1305461 [Atractiella rhizophila]|nr:hypothetical protein BT69DRAFT_1305461 [Atractiella rhizophila]
MSKVGFTIVLPDYVVISYANPDKPDGLINVDHSKSVSAKKLAWDCPQGLFAQNIQDACPEGSQLTIMDSPSRILEFILFPSVIIVIVILTLTIAQRSRKL